MDVDHLLTQITNRLRNNNWRIVTVESCTAGGLAYYLTKLPGSSDIFERGYITYSNIAKIQSVGVHSDTLKQYGAVSEQTAKAMVEGGLRSSQADVGIAITGIAGPAGGTTEKPVGTVWLAAKFPHVPLTTKLLQLDGDRTSIREQAIQCALELILEKISN